MLDRALKLIAQPSARRRLGLSGPPQKHGHDLSLAVMQAKALRSAVDSGLEVPPEVIDLAIQSVREHYRAGQRLHAERRRRRRVQRRCPASSPTTASGSVAGDGRRGVVCLQEFGQYDDWRIEKNMEVIGHAVARMKPKQPTANGPVRRLHAVLRRPGPVPGRRQHWEDATPDCATSSSPTTFEPEDPLEDG